MSPFLSSDDFFLQDTTVFISSCVDVVFYLFPHLSYSY